MKKSASLLAMLGCLVAVSAHADCLYPKAPPKAPDGRTATEQEMMDAMQSVKAYDAEVVKYQDCLQNEERQKLAELGPDAPKAQIQQIKSFYTKKVNAAREEVDRHALSFNEQVQIYQKRKKG